MSSRGKAFPHLYFLSFLFVFTGCGGREGTSAGGSGQNFTVSGAALSGNGTLDGGTSGVLPLSCGIEVQDSLGVRRISYQTNKGTCGMELDTSQALSGAGFSLQQIALAQEAVALGPGNYAVFPAFQLAKQCKHSNALFEPNFICVGVPSRL